MEMGYGGGEREVGEVEDEVGKVSVGEGVG